MALSDFTIIRRSMGARLFSTVTTVVTVAVAVGLMLVLLGMRDAGERAFARGSGNMDLLISRDASPLVAVLNGVFYANAPRNFIEWEKYEQIAQSQPWAWAIPTQLGDSYRGLPVMATVEEFFTAFEPARGEPWRIASGRLFERPFEVVVGAEAARLGHLGIGDIIHLTHGGVGASGRGEDAAPAHVHREFEYRVVGILEPTGSSHDRVIFSDLISSWILHAHDRRLAELGPGIENTRESDLLLSDRKITGIYARVVTRPGRDVSAVLQSVFDQLRRDTSITVAHPVVQIRELFRIVSNIDRIFIGMAAVVMVSSGIAIMLALYNSMEQRRRQIAVLRVLGCSRGRVFGLIVTESAVLGMLGAAAGVLLGFVAGEIVAGAMRRELGLVIQPRIGGEWLLVITVATVLLASAAGVVPAMMAYRTSVARSLRPIG